MTHAETTRLAVDIGGTFTDVALAHGDEIVTHKVPTTPAAPEDGVMSGVETVLAAADVSPEAVGLVLHGTTLTTNAIIERKGARTALIVSEGFRDSVEMAYENRFQQYDINIEKPAPLVPRYLRWPVRERMSAKGIPVTTLDEARVMALSPEIVRYCIESIAVGFLHSYANDAHERRVGEILRDAHPDIPVTLSSEVCPEIREYGRLSTACANAYVQPVMARYLGALAERLRGHGLTCPLLMMMSSGGLTTLETAIRFPVRLVESGPAGGAILASRIAAERGLDRVLSFDMGGTTAKICLIDDGAPQTARSFEVARAYRFTKGSGLPLSIPVIKMVEIGAGGGSIARVDSLGRVRVGPDSAGAAPGPACYGGGGVDATVTDADLVLGRIDAADFAGGDMPLAADKAAEALGDSLGETLEMTPPLAAFAVSEVVEETMASAARVHAVELGKDMAGRTLVAFGGAAPLHAAQLVDKLGMDEVVVPANAGVGSAIGFLKAPIAYEIVRSQFDCLSRFDADAALRLLGEMRAAAEGVVRLGAPEATLRASSSAQMRYHGQGHEISVAVPDPLCADALHEAFEAAYRRHYGRTIPGVDIEVLTWTLELATEVEAPAPVSRLPACEAGKPETTKALFDCERTAFVDAAFYRRDKLRPGTCLAGPALIAEVQTTTVVPAGFEASIDSAGAIVMRRQGQGEEA
jgi:N-methylhydantoinase A